MLMIVFTIMTSVVLATHLLAMKPKKPVKPVGNWQQALQESLDHIARSARREARLKLYADQQKAKSAFLSAEAHHTDVDNVSGWYF
jgi:hypothetical protein